MGAYIPVIIRVISAVIWYFMANSRGVGRWVFRGPFAVPLLFLARPADRDSTKEA